MPPPPTSVEPTEPESSSTNTNSKRHKPGPTAGKKPSAEVLQRRKEGRIKAAATIAQNLKKTGIGRFEEENGFGLTSVQSIPLINQKNYFTEYLKRDEQVSFVRNWRAEKLLQSKITTLKKDQVSSNSTNGTNGNGNGDTKNFDDFDLNNIELEMNRKKQNASVVADDDEEEEDDEEETEEVAEEKAKIGHDVIVIHPGSSYIRIGRATDAVPETIPTVIAVPLTNSEFNKVQHESKPPRPIRQYRDSDTNKEDQEPYFGEEFDEVKGIVTKDFRARMRYYKRRILPNSRETAANFNKKQESERIPDHNDPYKKEWIDLKSPEYSNRKYFVGDEALKLPINSKKHNIGWKLRYPIVRGNFNENSLDYNSPQEILGDLANIIIDSLNKLDIKNLMNLKVMLIIPDLYDKKYVETWCEILFKFVGFGRLGIIQEAVAATFGAGATTACVVDVGSQTTKISCVDEGMIMNDSRIILNYGGDQITECFIKLLFESSFPYKELDLSSRIDDWELANDLKHNFVTFQDADIAVQLYNFYKRKPFETTEKFEFKVFDEVMLAPLGLFYPQFFQPQIEDNLTSIPSFQSVLPKNQNRKLFTLSQDQYNGKLDNPTSRSQQILKSNLSYADLSDEELLLKLCKEKLSNEDATSNNSNSHNAHYDSKDVDTNGAIVLNDVPLEKAIIESITNAGLMTDFSKLKRLYDNLLIVGGGFGKINGYDLILSDRINIWRPKILSNSNLETILGFVQHEITKNEEVKKTLIKELKTIKQKEIHRQQLEEFEKVKAEFKSKGESGDSSKEPESGDSPTVNVNPVLLPPSEPNLDDIALSQEEMANIEEQTALKLDFDTIDNFYDQGTLLPVNVLPPPREFDPAMLTWKGGSVYGRLKVVNEMWITTQDWDLLESRCLYYKSLFNY
ncbi:actin-related protein [Scheffersomyces amazonensis]|uniref:actin-related protein n=1 Tax=Scheffersomyces amazonensis TaxID=1078765 RepID=UPI00315DCC7B